MGNVKSRTIKKAKLSPVRQQDYAIAMATRAVRPLLRRQIRLAMGGSLDEEAELRHMTTALSPVMYKLAVYGLANSLDEIYATGVNRKLFRGLIAVTPKITGRIRSRISTLMADTFWRSIVRTSKEIANKVLQGLPKEKHAAAIRRFVQGRSKVIGTTEGLTALNMGRQAGIDTAIEQGYRLKKRWTTMADERVRDTHAALDGLAIPGSQHFLVGGHSAMYPGDPSLPIEERAGCRCWLVLDGIVEPREIA